MYMYVHVYSTTDLVRLADAALEGVLQAQHWDGPGRDSGTEQPLMAAATTTTGIRVHK